MKKIAIIGLSVLLSACVSETYITDVTSESYREDYKSDAVSKPIMASESAVVEQDVKPEVVKMTAKPEVVKMTAKPEEKKVVKLTPKEQVKPVKIVPPSKKQAGIQRFGYTIQVVAVGSQAKVDQFANKLPQNGQPIWENYKVVNGTKWFSVLYGDYATSAEAQQAISTLPTQFQQLKPFVKSIDAIKNSSFPTLNKLN
ncbi:SPOR domain-containing protein [Vibrio parahaemolyticus]|uniref:SPOR domain-containing protein n=1 Tax=Vibrio parahaemolyticus TaxID=670 RepID=UPI00111ED496|nr:SPOR domain-containing protein [Vibrio parahaemolyticus]EHR1280329.1 SPOR domain-containing protein [Vibrio parahaemolyticus]EJM7146197.1 SPOR domain-containing protein [Vibrio parahaemolyticus]TOZ87830.1 SPOR domain-containing protein [Vibrio parahaemolyticus]